MKRIGAIVFHGAAVVSLLVLIGTMALWMASYRSEYDIYRAVERGRQQIGISRGEIYLRFQWQGDDYNAPRNAPSEWRLGEAPASDDFYAEVARHSSNVRRPVAGFFFGRSTFNRLRLTELLIPIWLLVVLLGMLPLIELTRYRRRRRRSHRERMGQCPRCGYDCRATPDRCPECGTGAVGCRTR